MFAVLHGGGLRQYLFQRSHLDLATVRWLTERLWMYFREKPISCVLLRSADTVSESSTEGPVFSMGVDHAAQVKALSSWAGQEKTQSFQTELYQLTYLISRLPRPFLAYFNGKFADKGAVLGTQSAYRVATEESEFSLPQTGHGFIPDGGLCYFLSRLDNQVGKYLALTGQTLTGTDLLHSGVCTHYQSSMQLELLLEALEHNSGFYDTVHERMEQMEVDWADTPYSLAPHLRAIEHCFQRQTVGEIMTALRQENGQWAKETLEILASKSPFALEVTNKLINEVQFSPLEDALKQEYDVAKRFMSHPDYAEGVAAASEGRKPKWETTHKQSDVEAYFKDFQEFTAELKLPLLDIADPFEISWQPPAESEDSNLEWTPDAFAPGGTAASAPTVAAQPTAASTPTAASLTTTTTLNTTTLYVGDLPPEVSEQSRHQPRQVFEVEEVDNCVLYVGNLPRTAEEQTLMDLFAVHGEVMSTEIVREKRSGKPRGWGTVTFATEEQAAAAMAQLDKAALEDREIDVQIRKGRRKTEKKPRRAREPAADGGESNGRRRADGRRRRRNDGESTEDAERPRRERKEPEPVVVSNPGCHLYVGNLAWEASNDDLTDLFAEYGTVVKADIARNRRGDRSRGWGTIEMGSTSETEAALAALNEFPFMERQLIVRLDARVTSA